MVTYSFRGYSLSADWIPDIDHPQGSNVTAILQLLKWKEYICASPLQKNLFDLSSKKMYINKIIENRCAQTLLISLKKKYFKERKVNIPLLFILRGSRLLQIAILIENYIFFHLEIVANPSLPT